MRKCIEHEIYFGGGYNSSIYMCLNRVINQVVAMKGDSKQIWAISDLVVNSRPLSFNPSRVYGLEDRKVLSLEQTRTTSLRQAIA